MTAVATRLMRYGHQPTYTADYRLVFDREPDIYGHVDYDREAKRWKWWLTAWRNGRELASGETRTRWGAWRRAQAASQRPGIARIRESRGAR